jgi:AraC-like DNA-binding protein
MDPLSNIIALLHPHTVLSRPITGRGSWGVRFEAYNFPAFSIILSGQCWLSLGKDPPVMMQRGDFMLLPTTPTLTLSSEPGAVCETGTLSRQVERYGEQGGEPDFTMLGGRFHVEAENTALLLQLLPKMIHIRAAETDTAPFAYITSMILDECGNERPGREILLERLVDVVLIEALRWGNIQERSAQKGLLAGMRDPAIALSLRAMHSNIQQEWTVARLAKQAGMSRSGYAKRFREVVGHGPMEYLSRWRMSLAQNALTHGSTPIEIIARDVGYGSASSFSTAFRKWTGLTPGAFARARQM